MEWLALRYLNASMQQALNWAREVDEQYKYACKFCSQWNCQGQLT